MTEGPSVKSLLEDDTVDPSIPIYGKTTFRLQKSLKLISLSYTRLGKFGSAKSIGIQPVN
jgi:hypothetical protein